MPKYISVINWTNQGIRNFEDTVDRANAVRHLARKRGDGDQAIRIGVPGLPRPIPDRVAERLCPGAHRSMPQPPCGGQEVSSESPSGACLCVARRQAGSGATRGA